MLKKTFTTSISTILLVLLLLSACGTNKTEQTNKEPEAAKEPTEEKVEIIISAAASLSDVAEEIQTAFNKENPSIKISHNFGSSGKLAQQITQGAPADIFLSASKKDTDFLSEKDLIVPTSLVDFASNELVVITEENQNIELPSLEDIATLDIKNIVIGDTQATPLGRYGKESLENIGVWDDIESKMVYASDVRQVLTHVETGNAELGIVFNTDAQRAEKVKVVTKIDSNLHSPIIYPGAVVKTSKNQDAAQKYLDFLTSEEGKKILESHGFITK